MSAALALVVARLVTPRTATALCFPLAVSVT